MTIAGSQCRSRVSLVRHIAEGGTGPAFGKSDNARWVAFGGCSMDEEVSTGDSCARSQQAGRETAEAILVTYQSTRKGCARSDIH